MANSLRVADSRKELKHKLVCRNTQPKQCLITAIPRYYSQKVLKRIATMDQNILGMGTVSEIGLFVLKIAILEAVRRFSRSHCPILWRSLQALQFVCVPPLKWIGKWGIFRGLLKFMQALSRPLLFLSLATLADGSSNVEDTSGRLYASQPSNDTQSNLATDVASNSRSEEGATQSQAPEELTLRLMSDLEKEGMILPERITEDELRRFYYSANGDLSRFITSVKKTIKWRQTFRFLSAQELEDWSEMVFWHGCDSKGHPCLIIRVALACSNIISDNRSRLPEVVVSQVEHGILHLAPARDPLVTVLMDCEGLTPFRFPVQMMRSCAILLQDHYPNRLSALFVVRLPPIARVVMQTLFKVLRPGTRRKLRIVGENYQKVLSEELRTPPSLLGGNCFCPKCSKVIGEEGNVMGPSREYESEVILPPHSTFHSGDCELFKFDRALKTIVIGLLVLLLCIIYAVGFHKVEGLLVQ